MFERVAGPVPRPEPPPDARNLVVVTLDSLRFDTCVEARPATMSRLGEIERRYSYASWTAPSHYNLLMGLLPHPNSPHLLAAAHYRRDYSRYQERLGVEGLGFDTLLPHLFLPTLLREHLGYRTHAMVSMPVLNPQTLLNQHFDSYELMDSHHDLPGMLDRLEFPDDRPSFYLLNVGETHYPYSFDGDDGSQLPHISGVHGAVKRLHQETDSEIPFSAADMADLRQRQVRSAAYVDGLLERLFDVVPRNTWLVVTSDHGELFGEDGYFGHGPMVHDKVLEVPFVEGLRP
jgi:arylsulfatase A-like enzyme